ncbi:uncharacterized protein M6B38_279340 [Iris pallida]|uniref:Uncharacterized protein n=1 Tax=Iris pallida TaxID=29817 RepID=A0AAX6I0B6_IRIPA|nr:uncharacterized protein M6B38_279340 [Iris pallida]
MGLAKVAFILLTISLLLPPRAVLGDFLSPLSPLLSPVLNGLCDTVKCGEGSCEVSLNHSLGFICKCNQGWSQLHLGDHFKFLPCIIPNCSLNYSCTKDSGAPAPAPAPLPPPPSNLSVFDPCMWAFCGGGECSSVASTYEHKCNCKEGFTNLFNSTTFPCYRDCSIGADCVNLGINLSNSTSSAASPPNIHADANSSAADPFAGKKMLWLYMLTISLAMVLVI